MKTEGSRPIGDDPVADHGDLEGVPATVLAESMNYFAASGTRARAQTFICR